MTDHHTEQRTALVTGATSGLGRAVAAALAGQGLRVLVHGRDRARTEALAAELPGARPLVADLGRLADVRDLAGRIRETQPALHVLVNNAGVGAGAPPQLDRELSPDGHELRFAVNYLAPVLLTRLLLPLLAASAPARVVNVGSAGQSPIDPRDLEFTRGYDGMQAYTRSKFALAAFTVDLAAEPEAAGVHVNCLHPATFMATSMVTEAGISPMNPVEAGVEPVMSLATGRTGGTVTGRYFNGTQVSSPHPGVGDAAARAALAAATAPLLAPYL
ncbi:SDR family NAD(P)-dependent oxidoreductase [Actinacidiphila rubida]|uniref:Short-chain dehydrogenase n=1 Tax=Actinacidiphila rubida TaxID=310780 RepID=A0A1H8U6M6_9ACTN|nr:SDR family NAD(P)-dependent oxidoreductase [Actinacidiphila rubida]SEO98942.1 Short-chain dehydrogenase [Actinacidiphila rubida]